MINQVTLKPSQRVLIGFGLTGLFLFFLPMARSQDRERSFEDRLRKANEAQNKLNEADEAEQQRLSALFAAKRAAMQEQDRHELRQMGIDFREKRCALKEEEARRERELQTSLKEDQAKLADALADLKAVMLVKEAYSEWKFNRNREEFSRKLKSDVAEQLAKAEAERERQKQIAIAAAMAYFTGGASLVSMAPALAAGANDKSAVPAMSATPGPGSAHAAVPPTPSEKVAGSNRGNGGSGTAKSLPGVRVYDSPAGPPILPDIDEQGVYPDLLDPIGFLVAGGVNAARGLGGLLRGGSKATPAARPTTTRIYSARELMRSAEDAGAYHNFPAQFDKYVLEGTKRAVSDKYILYTRPGSLNGRAGTFEMGVQPSPSGGVEVIKHRFFRPDGPPPLP